MTLLINYILGLFKDINLDNEEALQEIKQQLSEIKNSTSKKVNMQNDNQITSFIGIGNDGNSKAKSKYELPTTKTSKFA